MADCYSSIESTLTRPTRVSDTVKSKIMNEIIPESPEKDTDTEEGNGYIPETPQKGDISPVSSRIPIPSLSRIRKSLGALDNNTNVQSPSKRRRTEKRSCTSESSALSRFKNYSTDKTAALQRVKVSLFHNKYKENKPKEETFSLNTKSFYGSANSVHDHYTLAPETLKPAAKQSARKKRSPPTNVFTHKRLGKKHKRGEINCGVGHGIKKPKRKRSSLKNDSMDSDKTNESITDEQNQSVEEKHSVANVPHQSANLESNANKVEKVETYDPSKKFFKYKSSLRSNFPAMKKDTPVASVVSKLHGKNSMLSTQNYKKSCLNATNVLVQNSVDKDTQKPKTVFNYSHISKEDNYNDVQLGTRSQTSRNQNINNHLESNAVKTEIGAVISKSMEIIYNDSILEDNNCSTESEEQTAVCINQSINEYLSNSVEFEEQTTSKFKNDLNNHKILDDSCNSVDSKEEPEISKSNVSTSGKHSKVLKDICNNAVESQVCTNNKEDINNFLKVANDSNCNNVESEKAVLISNNEQNVNYQHKVSENNHHNPTESKEKTVTFKSKNDASNHLKVLEDDCYSAVESEERIAKSNKQKDVNDLLKILEEDWVDDVESSKETCNKSNTSSMNLLNNIFKDTTVTSAIENIYNNAFLNSKDLTNPVDYVSDHVQNTKLTEETGEKYYPLFYKGCLLDVTTKESNLKKRKQKVDQSKFCTDEKQYQIDAGQKLFGAIQCKECKLVYHVGDKDDEKMHLKYHNNLQVLKFQGWKDERVVYNDPTGTSRIILVEPNDSSVHKKKVMEVLRVIDQDLGLSDEELSNYKDNKIYLYVRDKTILGVLIAEQVTTAFRMIPELIDLNCCTSESSSVKCGINVVWTAKDHRGQGIATKLVDILRSSYYYDYFMSLDDIAFSVPTPSGKLFAEKYTKTNNFKVY